MSTLLERRRQQFFRSKLEVEEDSMTNEDHSAIAVLAARFAEGTYEIMALAEVIEDAIDRRMSIKPYGTIKPKEEPCEKS